MIWRVALWLLNISKPPTNQILIILTTFYPHFKWYIFNHIFPTLKCSFLTTFYPHFKPPTNIFQWWNPPLGTPMDTLPGACWAPCNCSKKACGVAQRWAQRWHCMVAHGDPQRAQQLAPEVTTEYDSNQITSLTWKMFQRNQGMATKSIEIGCTWLVNILVRDLWHIVWYSWF